MIIRSWYKIILLTTNQNLWEIQSNVRQKEMQHVLYLHPGKVINNNGSCMHCSQGLACVPMNGQTQESRPLTIPRHMSDLTLATINKTSSNTTSESNWWPMTSYLWLTRETISMSTRTILFSPKLSICKLVGLYKRHCKYSTGLDIILVQIKINQYNLLVLEQFYSTFALINKVSKRTEWHCNNWQDSALKYWTLLYWF